MQKKKSFAIVALLLIMSLMLAACGGGNNAQQGNQQGEQTPALNADLIFTSGGTSGTYYPYAGAIGQIWMNTIEGVSVTVQSSGGSADNLNKIAAGDADIAIVQNDTMTYAYQGTESFANAGANTTFSTMGTVYAEVVQLIARADSGITSVADLKGKAVSVGDLGSGVEANAKQIMAAFGLTFDDVKAQHLGFGASTDAMKDGQLDAAFITAGIPTTAVTEFATTNDVVVVPITGAEIDQLLADYGYYTTFVIPADTYAGVDTDVTTVAVKATIVVSNTLDEELVYQLTKSLFENKADLVTAHAKGSELDINTAVQGVSVPFHAGAERYYKEVGVIQ